MGEANSPQSTIPNQVTGIQQTSISPPGGVEEGHGSISATGRLSEILTQVLQRRQTLAKGQLYAGHCVLFMHHLAWSS